MKADQNERENRNEKETIKKSFEQKSVKKGRVRKSKNSRKDLTNQKDLGKVNLKCQKTLSGLKKKNIRFRYKVKTDQN